MGAICVIKTYAGSVRYDKISVMNLSVGNRMAAFQLYNLGSNLL